MKAKKLKRGNICPQVDYLGEVYLRKCCRIASEDLVDEYFNQMVGIVAWHTHARRQRNLSDENRTTFVPRVSDADKDKLKLACFGRK